MIGLIAYGIVASASAAKSPVVSAFQATPHFYDLVLPKKKKYEHKTKRHKANIEKAVAKKAAARKEAETNKLATGEHKIAEAHPSPKISEAVLIKFQDGGGNTVDGANVQVDIYDKDNNLVSTNNYKTGDSKPGVVYVKATKLPAVIKTSLVTGEPWEEQDPTEGVFSLTGTEGEVVSNTKTAIVRQIYGNVTLDRPYTEFQVNAGPNASVYWGGDKVGDSDSSGVVDVKLPKMPDDTKVTFYVTKTDGGVTYDSEADGTAGGPAKVDAKPFELNSVNDVQIANYPDDSTQAVTSGLIQSAYGKPKKKEKTLEGVTADGAEWWEYPKQGLDFKMRKVRDERGKEDELVECIRFTTPQAGSVAGVAVGSSNDDATKVLGRGIMDPRSQSPLAQSYLDGGLVVHQGASSIDWMEIRRPISLLKDGIDMSPANDKSKIFLEIGQGQPEFAPFVRSRFQNLPGVQLVDSASNADLVIHIDETEFTPKSGNLLGLVPMLYSANCKIAYTITDTASGQGAQDLNGNTIPTDPVDVTAKADYATDVEGGAALLAVVGVAGLTLRNPAERLIVMAALGATIKVATDRMKDTMHRAVPRTNELAMAEALDPVFRSLERASLFRARVSDVSYDQKTVTLNVGSTSGISNGMEFLLYNENVSAFSDKEGALKEDLVLARVMDAEPDHAICRLVQVKKSVSKKAYEDSSEKPDDEAITSVLAPETGLVNARVLFRNKSDAQQTEAGH